MWGTLIALEVDGEIACGVISCPAMRERYAAARGTGAERNGESIQVSQIASYLETINSVCRRQRLEAAVVGHAGNGILYVELRPGDATSRLVEAIGELRRQAQEERGSLVVERCPIELKRGISVWGEPGSDFYLMQRLKQQFDAKGTFVKGRFVGGL